MKADIDVLRMRFEEDADYTTEAPCYLDKETGRCFWHSENIDRRPDWESENDWREQDFLLRTYSERFVFVPAPDHGEWHTVFRDWCSENGISMGVASIGGMLEGLDEGERREWQNYRFGYAHQRAEAFLKDNGAGG